MFIYVLSKFFFLSLKPQVISLLFLFFNDYLTSSELHIVHTNANTLMSFMGPNIQVAKIHFSVFVGLDFLLVNYSGSSIKDTGFYLADWLNDITARTHVYF